LFLCIHLKVLQAQFVWAFGGCGCEGWMICEDFALSGGVTSINKAGALDGHGIRWDGDGDGNENGEWQLQSRAIT